MKEVTYSRAALKRLRGIPRNEAERITSKVKQYAMDPKSLANNVEVLTASSLVRLRVADWRVIMDDQGAILEVLQVGPRGSIYD